MKIFTVFSSRLLTQRSSTSERPYSSDNKSESQSTSTLTSTSWPRSPFWKKSISTGSMLTSLSLNNYSCQSSVPYNIWSTWQGRNKKFQSAGKPDCGLQKSNSPPKSFINSSGPNSNLVALPLTKFKELGKDWRILTLKLRKFLAVKIATLWLRQKLKISASFLPRTMKADARAATISEYWISLVAVRKSSTAAKPAWRRTRSTTPVHAPMQNKCNWTKESTWVYIQITDMVWSD